MAVKIAVVYYSMYGHISVLAESVAEGLKAAGAEVTIYQVPETLPEEVLTKMGAPAKNQNHPVITADKLTDYAGIVWGIPTRYGRAVAQISNFFDTTGGLWAKQALNGKFTAVFSSTGTQHGGQETTTLTSISYFAHHGLIYVPLGYPDASLMDMSAVNGGTPWGASAVAGPTGARAVSDHEKAIAVLQGKRFAEVVSTFEKGKTPGAAEPSSSTLKPSEHKKEASSTNTSTSSKGEKKPKKRFSLFGKH